MVELSPAAFGWFNWESANLATLAGPSTGCIKGLDSWQPRWQKSAPWLATIDGV